MMIQVKERDDELKNFFAYAVIVYAALALVLNIVGIAAVAFSASYEVLAFVVVGNALLLLLWVVSSAVILFKLS